MTWLKKSAKKLTRTKIKINEDSMKRAKKRCWSLRFIHYNWKIPYYDMRILLRTAMQKKNFFPFILMKCKTWWSKISSNWTARNAMIFNNWIIVDISKNYWINRQTILFLHHFFCFFSRYIVEDVATHTWKKNQIFPLN